MIPIKRIASLIKTLERRARVAYRDLVMSRSYPIVTGYFIRKMKRMFAANQSFTISPRAIGGFSASIDGVRCVIKTREDLNCLREIFLERVYDFSYAGDVVVVDLGMNVGFASLFFAAQQNVKAVYAYELFPETFKDALENLSLNDALQKKISSRNVGVGAKDQAEICNFSYLHKASSGNRINVGGKFTESDLSDIKKVQVTICDIGSLFTGLLEKHRGTRFLLKCDIEGAEFEVIQRLIELDLLRHFSFIQMECHEGRGEEMAGLLATAGYVVYPKDERKQIIYAAFVSGSG